MQGEEGRWHCLQISAAVGASVPLQLGSIGCIVKNGCRAASSGCQWRTRRRLSDGRWLRCRCCIRSGRLPCCCLARWHAPWATATRTVTVTVVFPQPGAQAAADATVTMVLNAARAAIMMIGVRSTASASARSTRRTTGTCSSTGSSCSVALLMGGASHPRPWRAHCQHTRINVALAQAQRAGKLRRQLESYCTSRHRIGAVSLRLRARAGSFATGGTWC